MATSASAVMLPGVKLHIISCGQPSFNGLIGRPVKIGERGWGRRHGGGGCVAPLIASIKGFLRKKSRLSLGNS